MRSLGRELALYDGEVRSVHLVGHPEPLEFERGAHVLTVRLPEKAADAALPVLRVARETAA